MMRRGSYACKHEPSSVDASAVATPDYNAGWIAIERSTLRRRGHYHTEAGIRFDGGFVEARSLRWDEPFENVWTTSDRCYLVNMTLGARPGAAATNLTAHTRCVPKALGRLLLVPPRQTIHCSARTGQARSIRCALDAKLFAPYFGEDGRPSWAEDQLRDAMHLQSNAIEWLMRRMYRELQRSDFASPRVVRLLSEQIVVEIVRRYDLGRSEPERYAGGLAPWRMRLINDRVHASGPAPHLQELASLCNLTVRHLSRAFRVETGQTIGQHIETVMVSRATAMLTSGDLIQDVAAKLGYTKSGSFASAYRRATGLLPSEVRAQGCSLDSTRC